ncbi:DUF1652 domain-containing protein [Pseudomonas sp.]|uniref:DUF1652 domain-containing protein n=1 Tax=Pseudomonas sp. TaxID=306 RepID=UPI0025845C08|nr:DUF1652 domain-containing protein [Pseudomonas sp.]
MLSTLELRNIIESSFLPMRCQCTVAQDKSLTIKVFDQAHEGSDFTVTGIQAQQLNSSRAIINLIAGLRADLKGQHLNEVRRVGERF